MIYACFVLSVSSSSWRLRRAAIYDCVTPWTFLLPFFISLALCYFFLVFFSHFSIAVTSLGEERANPSAFRTFVRFVLVWFCLSSSSSCLGWAVACDSGTPWTFLFLPRLGKRELILVLFVRLFDLRLFGFCLFPLSLGVWVGLRLVIVVLPGLFSYLFCSVYVYIE